MKQTERRAVQTPANTFHLPESYGEIERIDLLENRRQLLLVNGLAVLIAAVMILPPLIVRGLHFREDGIGLILLKIVILLTAAVVYMALHELVHGVFIRKYSGRRPGYGVGMGYACAGSDAYFNKKSYIIIALSPVIIWGVALLILNLALSSAWFWVVYGVQITNISGAAGDYYVTYRMLKMPSDILVRDSGTKMAVYAPKQ